MTKTLNRRLALAGLLTAGSSAPAMGQSFFDNLFREVLSDPDNGLLSESDAASGIRTALTQGVGTAIDALGQYGGFLLDNAVRIPLPGFLRDVQSTLSQFGMSGELDELETQLNRGAEVAVPLARDIFVDAISGMSIQDAIGIVQGPQNSATEYLQSKTLPTLASLFSPVMKDSLQGTGAMNTLQEVSGQLNSLPFVAGLGLDAEKDLIDHGVDYGLKGVFHYIGEEEAAIRSNPGGQASDILRKVFGS